MCYFVCHSSVVAGDIEVFSVRYTVVAWRRRDPDKECGFFAFPHAEYMNNKIRFTRDHSERTTIGCRVWFVISNTRPTTISRRHRYRHRTKAYVFVYRIAYIPETVCVPGSALNAWWWLFRGRFRIFSAASENKKKTRCFTTGTIRFHLINIYICSWRNDKCSTYIRIGALLVNIWNTWRIERLRSFFVSNTRARALCNVALLLEHSNLNSTYLPNGFGAKMFELFKFSLSFVFYEKPKSQLVRTGLGPVGDP